MADPLFRIHRSQLLPALIAASEASERRAKIPVLSNVLLKPEGDQLVVRGTDLDIEVEVTCDLLDEGTGTATTINAMDLRDIVKNLPETAEIDFLPGKFHGQIIIRSGRATFSIACLPETDFPSIASAVTGQQFETDMTQFTQALSKVSYAALKIDTGHRYLMGIHVHPSDDGRKLNFVATDGRGMALVRIATANEARFDGIILPLKTASAIGKLFGDMREPARIEFGENMMRIACCGVSMFSRLVEGQFPVNYPQIIPEKPDSAAVVTVASLTAAASRVSLVGTELDKDGIKVTLGRDQMRVELYSKNGESAVDHVAVEYDGEDGFVTGFNRSLLNDTLSSIKTQDVRIHFGGTPPHVVFRPIGDIDEVFVIAPMRARGADGA